MTKWIDGQPPAQINWEARYTTLREVYRQEHPRITDAAIDAFVDGKIAGGGVAAGPEPTEDTANQ